MFIPEETYKKIIDYIPITCIDFFIIHENSILLWKRKNEPAKWVWFVPWWRILKAEIQKEAQKRKLLEETWINIEENISININLLGVYDTIFDRNAFSDNQLTHTINVTYVVELIEKSIEISTDDQNEILKWFDMETDYYIFHPYIKNLIDDYKKTKKIKNI